MDIEPEPVYDDAWFAELGSYLVLMSDIQNRTRTVDSEFDSFLALAAPRRSLFFDARWRDGYRQYIQAMQLVERMIDDAKPSEALGEVYLLFKYQQIVYAMRTAHAVKAFDYLTQCQFDLAAEELTKFRDATVDLARMVDDRERILDPIGKFATLREYIAEKKRERARVAASQRE